MSDSIKVIRVVIASPGDVEAEREAAANVIDELNQFIAADRGIRLEPLRWERLAFPGFHPLGPQGLIDPLIKIEDCDLLLGIFWKHFGTKTPNGTTGTEHEFRTAYELWKQNQRPQIMVYFNQRPYSAKSKEETDQWGRVLEFQKDFPKEGLWWPYRGTAQFEKLLRRHLSAFIQSAFPIAGKPDRPGRAVSAEPASQQPDYFVVQSRIIEESTRNFVGRVSAQQAFQQFLKSHAKGYFTVRAGPGQGKTAFACQLIKQGNYVHHLISRTGGRADSRLILRSLIAQLMAKAGSSMRVPEAPSELTKLFEELLGEVAKREQSLVVVIDALDELPPEAGDDPPYLVANTLPDRVFFVVTSRPGRRLDRLQAIQAGLPRTIYDLGPLGLDEMRHILRARKPDMPPGKMDRIAEDSQGNPLYLRAVLDQLELEPNYDLRRLPSTLEGFFRNAVSALEDEKGSILHDTLAVLSAARTPMSLQQLSRILGQPQRKVDERGIRPVRQFLLELDGGLTFYHARFHDFVTQAFLYPDEMGEAHQRITRWLGMPENLTNDYRWASVAYHLFEAQQFDTLLATIDERFLTEKARRFGYAVLEDLELCARCLLAQGDMGALQNYLSVIDRLAGIMGERLAAEVSSFVQPYRSGPTAFRTRLIAPAVEAIPGLDVYVGILPKGQVSADFIEVVPVKDHLMVAIGDVPAIGLKSAFVARFAGMLFRNAALKLQEVEQVVLSLNRSITHQNYFQRVSMQCMDIHPARQVAYVINAGHEYPVHYSAKESTCDVLPVTGDLLPVPLEERPGVQPRLYQLTVERGDVLVMISDGLTETHKLKGESYGYRFKDIIKEHAQEDAKAIGEAILDGWKLFPREDDWADDVSVVVMRIV